MVVLATGGSFAWVPFLHAARRLRTPKARILAGAYVAVDVLIYVLMLLTPPNNHGPNAVSTIGGLLMVGVMIVGCLQLATLRRMVYLGEPEGGPDDHEPVNPAVKAVLAARARRAEARALAAKDPLLARELHIGRPDVAREYDDGGLVDLNSAPAEVIAQVCGLPPDAATSVVDARERHGGVFSNVDEVFVVAQVPVSAWDRVRDRAIVLA